MTTEIYTVATDCFPDNHVTYFKWKLTDLTKWKYKTATQLRTYELQHTLGVF